MTPARDAGGAATGAMVERLGESFRTIFHFDPDQHEVEEMVAYALTGLEAGRDRDAALAQRAAEPGEAVAEEVERLTRERDEAFRRHAITEREACDAATRIGELTRELERVQLQLVTTRMQRDTARLRGDRACERATASERALADRDKLVAALRADLANAAGGLAQHTCEGCGAPLMVDEEAATTTDVAGCWPYVTGEDRLGQCWRYRTVEGSDRAWPKCALAAEHSPAPAADTGGGHGG